MKNPIDIIKQDDEIFIFYDDLFGILQAWVKKYGDKTTSINLGYDVPEITTFKFIGHNYPCIRLWYDGMDRECSDSYKKLIDKFGIIR